MKVLKRAKKSLGQNFLIDKNIINKIIKIGNIKNNNTIMEIGPGYGNLTQEILNMKPKNILAIEKDKKLSLFLIKKFKNKVKDANIMLELRKRQHYKKKSDRQREKRNLIKLRHKYRQEKEKNLY